MILLQLRSTSMKPLRKKPTPSARSTTKTHDESYVARFAFTKLLKRVFLSSTTDGSRNVVWTHGESKGKSELGMLGMLWGVFSRR
jgi:hypothetical protein